MMSRLQTKAPGRAGLTTKVAANNRTVSMAHSLRPLNLSKASLRTSPARPSTSIAVGSAHLTRTRKAAIVVNSAAPTTVTPSAPQKPSEVSVKIDEVSVVPVSPDIICLRNTSCDRVKYEIEFGLKRGSTDNSYIIKGKGGSSVLIDVPLQIYAETFGEALGRNVDATKISHIVLTHMAPNRLDSLKLALKQATGEGRADGQVEVHLTNPALQLVQTSFGEDPESASLLTKVNWIVARSGVAVKIGEGRSLQFVVTPTPRWPDLMCVYDTSSQVLFTSKIFAAHVAPGMVGGRESAFDVGGWQRYGEDWQYFFDCMFAPVARQAAAAFEKLDIVFVDAPPATLKVTGMLNAWASAFQKMLGPKNKDKSGSTKLVVRALAPLHGPVIKNAKSQLLNEYRDWIEAQIKAAGTSTIAVMYASAYGNTAALAQAISRGITKGGVGVQTLNLELVPLEEVAAAAREVNGFVIGSPTLGGHMPTQVQAALGTVLKEPRSKSLPCGVFGSFGWSGEAVDEMEGRLKNAGFGLAFDSIRVKFRPTAADLQRCEQSGRDLATSVKRKLKNKEKITAGQVKEVAGSGPQLAMGRVVGSLSVVTAKDEDLTSAMLASWVSQASFDPPGLTISVKKDRAIENQLIIGSKFAISVLAEGKDKAIMKALSRPFLPGENRLEGLATVEGEKTGCPILTDAASSLECQVVSRMEAGDHWIVYGQVLGGKVLDEGAVTSVHHRKVGNHY